ncbi:MAG: hypothetical protein KC457_01005, partial [Myxococcales bacterium]|nr:hypothetical protein [Myxococcales bacterium]
RGESLEALVGYLASLRDSKVVAAAETTEQAAAMLTAHGLWLSRNGLDDTFEALEGQVFGEALALERGGGFVLRAGDPVRIELRRFTSDEDCGEVQP